MPSHSLMNRRTLLKGAGAALALPLLESMGWADEKRAKPPVRLGFMYMPHGVIMDQFWPKSPETFLTAPPPALEPLQPVLDRCLMAKGISGVPTFVFAQKYAVSGAQPADQLARAIRQVSGEINAQAAE